jgi:hypothetical protein
LSFLILGQLLTQEQILARVGTGRKHNMRTRAASHRTANSVYVMVLRWQIKKRKHHITNLNGLKSQR